MLGAPRAVRVRRASGSAATPSESPTLRRAPPLPAAGCRQAAPQAPALPVARSESNPCHGPPGGCEIAIQPQRKKAPDSRRRQWARHCNPELDSEQARVRPGTGPIGGTVRRGRGERGACRGFGEGVLRVCSKGLSESPCSSSRKQPAESPDGPEPGAALSTRAAMQAATIHRIRAAGASTAQGRPCRAGAGPAAPAAAPPPPPPSRRHSGENRVPDLFTRTQAPIIMLEGAVREDAPPTRGTAGCSAGGRPGGAQPGGGGEAKAARQKVRNDGRALGGGVGE